MRTIDEMRGRMLLATDQLSGIGVRIVRAREAIMAMPPSLWRNRQLAGVFIEIEGDLSQPSALTAP